eukprot:2111082-Rhodomonas_salina.5
MQVGSRKVREMVLRIPQNALSSRPSTHGRGCGCGWRQTPQPPSGWKGQGSKSASTSTSSTIQAPAPLAVCAPGGVKRGTTTTSSLVSPLVPIPPRTSSSPRPQCLSVPPEASAFTFAILIRSSKS